MSTTYKVITKYDDNRDIVFSDKSGEVKKVNYEHHVYEVETKGYSNLYSNVEVIHDIAFRILDEYKNKNLHEIDSLFKKHEFSVDHLKNLQNALEMLKDTRLACYQAIKSRYGIFSSFVTLFLLIFGTKLGSTIDKTQDLEAQLKSEIDKIENHINNEAAKLNAKATEENNEELDLLAEIKKKISRSNSNGLENSIIAIDENGNAQTKKELALVILDVISEGPAEAAKKLGSSYDTAVNYVNSLIKSDALDDHCTRIISSKNLANVFAESVATIYAEKINNKSADAKFIFNIAETIRSNLNILDDVADASFQIHNLKNQIIYRLKEVCVNENEIDIMLQILNTQHVFYSNPNNSKDLKDKDLNSNFNELIIISVNSGKFKPAVVQTQIDKISIETRSQAISNLKSFVEKFMKDCEEIADGTFDTQITRQREAILKQNVKISEQAPTDDIRLVNACNESSAIKAKAKHRIVVVNGIIDKINDSRDFGELLSIYLENKKSSLILKEAFERMVCLYGTFKPELLTELNDDQKAILPSVKVQYEKEINEKISKAAGTEEKGSKGIISDIAHGKVSRDVLKSYLMVSYAESQLKNAVKDDEIPSSFYTGKVKEIVETAKARIVYLIRNRIFDKKEINGICAVAENNNHKDIITIIEDRKKIYDNYLKSAKEGSLNDFITMITNDLSGKDNTHLLEDIKEAINIVTSRVKNKEFVSELKKTGIPGMPPSNTAEYGPDIKNALDALNEALSESVKEKHNSQKFFGIVKG